MQSRQSSPLLLKGKGCYLIEKPRTEDHLHKVVDDEHAPKVHWFPVLHDPGAQHLHEISVAEADRQRRKGTAHQQPVVDAWICGQSDASLNRTDTTKFEGLELLSGGKEEKCRYFML